MTEPIAETSAALKARTTAISAFATCTSSPIVCLKDLSHATDCGPQLMFRRRRIDDEHITAGVGDQGRGLATGQTYRRDDHQNRSDDQHRYLRAVGVEGLLQDHYPERRGHHRLGHG